VAGKVRSIDGDGAHRLICAVLEHSIRDMRSNGEKSVTIVSYDDFVTATVWLGSNQAWDWFDHCSLDQSRALLVLDWQKYAKKILLSNYRKLSENQIEILTKGVAALEEIQRQTSR